MAAPSDTPIKAYRGNCHCGAFVFETKLPEITTASICNCSICHKKGTVWAVTKSGNVTWVKGDLETLKSYVFGEKKFEHKFCATCGTPVAFSGYFAPPKEGEEQDVGLNIRCLQNGQVPDIWDMKTSVFDGASLGTPYEKPEYTGPLPKMQVDQGKLYTGGCHCGAVKVALISKPLDKTYTDPVYECNCSGCIRAAGCSAHPHKDQVVVEGDENIDTYAYGGLRAWEKCWCKHCGVFIGRRALPLSDEVVASLPEMVKKWTVDMDHLRPINLRILPDVDLGDITTTHIEGYSIIPPPYENP